MIAVYFNLAFPGLSCVVSQIIAILRMMSTQDELWVMIANNFFFVLFLG